MFEKMLVFERNPRFLQPIKILTSLVEALENVTVVCKATNNKSNTHLILNKYHENTS